MSYCRNHQPQNGCAGLRHYHNLASAFFFLPRATRRTSCVTPCRTQIISSIYQAYLSPSIEPTLLSLFLSLQHLISKRTHFFHVAHIRSHQPFPGILQEGNSVADAAATAASSSPLIFAFSSPTPWESHSYFHQNKKALIKQFKISATEATAILQQCPTCSKQAHSVPMGVNPRGTECNQIWQMDVTQYASFSPWKYLHVSIDTYSGFIMATPQRGEASKHIINHCIRTFATLGRPKELKTDNGPGYTGSAFAAFCQKWGITHKFGIPYNSKGQAIIERANQTLKHALDRYIETKGKGPPSLPAVQDILNLCLYTLNFLNLTGLPATSAACRHFASQPAADHQRPLVYYRCLRDPAWRGPAQLITWGRGYAAIQLPDKVLWVPGRCVRPCHLPLSPDAQDVPPPPHIRGLTGVTPEADPQRTAEEEDSRDNRR